MITATISNGVISMQLPIIQVPMTEEIIENATDVEPLDGNVYTSLNHNGIKRLWRFPYESMFKADYDPIKQIYLSQFSDYQYPTLSIPYYDTINDIPVRMYLNPKEVYNNCGDIQNLELSFRETNQLPSGSS